MVTPVRYSTDPRDVGWVRENIPCQTACPADTNVPAYIQMILESRYGLPTRSIATPTSCPGVLGRICSRPCEDACRHGWPGPARRSTCHLKRSAADLKPSGHRITENLFTPSRQADRGDWRRPAGIAAAHDLSMLGHDVTILEHEKEPAACCTTASPRPACCATCSGRVRNALRLGRRLRTGVRVGNGDGEVRLSSLLPDYDAAR